MSERTRFQRVDALFEAALHLPPDERAAYLAQACGDDAALRDEVEELLGFAEPAEALLGEHVGNFAAPLVADLSGVLDADPAFADGARLGPWRILREVGRGGMGVVYLAERADGAFELRVALKVVKRGLDTAEVLRRFQSERRILAAIDSPHIARVLDGGETPDGRPYLVMEFVDGRPILEWCETRALDPRGRVALCRDLCGAVHEAHRRLIVHRDVKPSNVLVTSEGVPKLLDFGIAKLLTGDDGATTATGLQPLTPEYAAPEQLRGEPVTTATDVYALGRLLRDLLAGILVRRDAPARELETIIQRAMAPEPDRRYGSALQFGEDLDRWLRGLPVLARPDSVAYRARKFVARNRGGVAAATLLLVLLVAFTVFLADARRRTAEALTRAEEERDTAEEIVGLLQGIFSAGDPTAVRPERLDTLRVATLLDRSVERVRRDLTSRPQVQARLFRSLGDTYRGLGLYEASAPLLGDALELERERGDSLALSEALNSMGLLELQRGRPAEAEPRFREALALRQPHVPPHDIVAIRAMSNLAATRQDQADFAEAAQLYEEAQRRLESAPVIDSTMLSTIINGRGMLAHRQGDLAQAAEHVERHLAIDRARLGPDHPRVALSTANFAFVRERLGDLDAADSLYASALGIFASALDDAHPLRYAVATSLANVRAKRGRHDEAGPMFEQALAGTRRVSGASPDLAVGLSQYADHLQARGMLDSAERVAVQAMEIERNGLGPSHPSTAATLVQVARIRCARGAHAEAIAAYREAIGALEARLPGGHPRLGDAGLGLGRCLTHAGRHADAEQQLRAVFASAGGGSTAPLPPRAVPVARALADLYDAWGRAGEAARYRALADAPSPPP